MFSFFLDRTNLSWVIVILMTAGCVLATITLSVMQYQEIARNHVTISTNYPGASPATRDNNVAEVIEQNMHGIDGLAYMASSKDSVGNIHIELTFKAGTNLERAQQQVQHQLQRVISKLPPAVQKSGISVSRGSSGFLMGIGMVIVRTLRDEHPSVQFSQQPK